MIVIAILIFFVLLLFDLPALVKERDVKRLTFYIALSVITLVYIIQYTLGYDVFSPIKTLSIFVGDTLGLNYENWQGHS